MVDESDIAIGAAALGGAYYLSTRGRGGGDSGQGRPGQIPLPIPGGGGGGGGLSPGIAGLLASGNLGGGGPQLGGLLEGFGGILQGQQQQFGQLLQGQQAGIGKLLESQQQLIGNLGSFGGQGGGLPDNLLTQEDLSGLLSNLDLGNSGGGGGGGGSGGSGSTGPTLSGTQQYNLLAAEQGNIPPEARGANPLLEAARGTGEAVGAALRTPKQAIDYGADVLGGDGPGAFSTTGGITGASYEAGQTTGEAIDTLPPAVVGGPIEMIANNEGPFNWG
jgi:hypothetical protein